MLGPLADNSGTTETHALLAGSPTIDTGDPSAVAGVGNVPLYDQRGPSFDRVVGGRARIDMGAFELQTLPSADFDGNTMIKGLDFLLWQLGFGTVAPNAAKTDGDADNDTDVDDNDLSVWESQFSQAAPLTAVFSSSGFEAFSEKQQPASLMVATSNSINPIPERVGVSIEQHQAAVSSISPNALGDQIGLEARDAALAWLLLDRSQAEFEGAKMDSGEFQQT